MPRRGRKSAPRGRYTPATHGSLLVHCGASPDLCVLTGAVADHLPAEVVEDPVELVSFVCRNRARLNNLIWNAHRAIAPETAHPDDGYPAHLGPVTRSMTLSEVERAIHQQPEEHVVFFDIRDDRQVARFGPAGTRAGGFDPICSTLLDSRLRVVAEVVPMKMTHNHPSGGFLSEPDFATALQMDLAEMRAVAPSGLGFVATRPRTGWPELKSVERVFKAAVLLATDLAEEEMINEDGCLDLDHLRDWHDIWREKFADTCCYPGFWARHGVGDPPHVRWERLVPAR